MKQTNSTKTGTLICILRLIVTSYLDGKMPSNFNCWRTTPTWDTKVYFLF